MKKLFLILGTFLLSLSTYAAMNVNKIDPPFWYAGMQNPELQLMVYGEDIGNSSVTVNYPGVSLSSTVKLESPNYLIVYLRLEKDVKPGKVALTFAQGKKKIVKEYGLVMKELSQIKNEEEFMLAQAQYYRNEKIKPMIDEKYGKGASEFFSQAIEAVYNIK